MALISCPECKKQVSDQAKSCPHCGVKLKKAKSDEAKAGRIVAVIVLVIVLVLGILVARWVSNSGMFGKNLTGTVCCTAP